MIATMTSVIVGSESEVIEEEAHANEETPSIVNIFILL